MSEIEESIKNNSRQIGQVAEIARVEMLGAFGITIVNNRNDFAGLIRNLGPAVLNKYGNISATAALYHYEEMRELAFKNAIGLELSRRAQNRRAAAQVSASIQVSTSSYAPSIKAVDVATKTEDMIKYSLSKYDSSGYIGGKNAALDYALREIAQANRDTILFNATLDNSVQGVQRIADPNACAFCLTVALGGSRSFASKYHDSCRCTIEPIFKGQSDFRPDYYDELEEKYKLGKAAADKARAEQPVVTKSETGEKKKQPRNASSKAVFAAIRKETGAK
jgi:hypothetical protein